MLNASYNLPSEDCNTEKQMVFTVTNCYVYTVYSLGSQILSPSVPSCPAAGRPGGTQHHWEGLPAPGKTQPGPRGLGGESDGNMGSAGPQPQLVPTLQAQPGDRDLEEQPSETTPPRSRWQHGGGARSTTVCGIRMPWALPNSWSFWGKQRSAGGGEALHFVVQRLRVRVWIQVARVPGLTAAGWPGDLGEVPRSPFPRL